MISLVSPHHPMTKSGGIVRSLWEQVNRGSKWEFCGSSKAKSWERREYCSSISQRTFRSEIGRLAGRMDPSSTSPISTRASSCLQNLQLQSETESVPKIRNVYL